MSMFKPLFSSLFSPVFSPVAGYEPETFIFATRVIDDGGTVEDLSFVNEFIVHAKINGYFNDIVAAYSPSWGVKGATTASKLYSITGADQDLEQTTGSKQPTISIKAQDGKTIITTDGISQMLQGTFPYGKPETVVLCGIKIISYISTSIFVDGSGGGLSSGALQQAGGSPNFKQNVGGIQGDANGDLPIGDVCYIRSLFNDPIVNGSKTQVENNAEVTGNLTNDVDMDGFTFGSAATDTLFSNVSLGCIVLLNSAVDGDYAAKMEALRVFSVNQYPCSSA